MCGVIHQISKLDILPD